MQKKPYKYNLPKVAETRQLVDMRVKAGMTLEEINGIYNLPHVSYLSQYLRKLGNEVPPFGGYDPLGKQKVIEWLNKKDLTMQQVAEHFGITQKGLLAYCKMYRINVRKPDIEEIKKLRSEGVSGSDIAAYYGVAPQYAYVKTRDNAVNLDTVDLDEAEKATIKKIDQLTKRMESTQRRIDNYKKDLEEIRKKKRKQ